MKEKIVLFFVTMLFMACVGVYAENLIYYQDSTATDTLKMIPVSGITPLPITGVLTVGSVTVSAGEPPSANITQVVGVSGVATDVASLANRRAITIINHSPTETVWASMDSSVASASVGAGVPIFPYGNFSTELASGKIVGLIASTSFNATVYQDGY
jgi:hypothetical protein